MGYNLTQINPAYELVSDVVVDTATTSVDFTGLSIGKEDDYMLVGTHIKTDTSSWAAWLYVNGNYTNSNYYVQNMYAAETGYGGTRLNEPRLWSMSSGGDYHTMFIAKLKLTNNGNAVWQSNYNYNYNSSVQYIGNNYTTSTFTTSSITSLRITANFTNGLGVGSRFQLYKRVAPIIADITISTATTSVDITGLSIDKGSEYMLVSSCVNTSGSNSNYMLYANATTSGYYTQYLYGAGGSVGAVRAGDTLFGNAYASSSSFENVNIKLTNNGYVVFQSNELMRYTLGSNIELLNRHITSTFTASSITSLRITSSVANGIGIGSRFQLIKLK